MKRIILLCLVFFMFTSTADAMDAKYYYDGMKRENTRIALPIISKYPNSTTFMKSIPNKYKKYEAIGRISNRNGWAGPEYETMGTGFVIDDYTILTNAHVVDDEHGKATEAKHLTFELNRNGDDIPYEFDVTEVIKVPYADVAILHTNDKLTDFAKPLKLATDRQIMRLKRGQGLYSVGYPFDGEFYEKRYYNKALFIMHSKNKTEFILKDKFRAGASGSPLMDSKQYVYGIRTYGYDLYGDDHSRYSRVEYAGAESLYGYTGNFVLEHMY